MENFINLLQTADFKTEKHVPVIETGDGIRKGEAAKITVMVGKEVPHPNKAEHHIRWIDVYFHPDGEKFPVQLGRMDFLAHGESTQGPETSTVYTHHEMSLSFKSDKPGTIFALSFCNIHGLWQSSKHVSLKQ